ALAPGLIADAIVVDDHVAGLPRVVAAIVGGELRYATRVFGHDNSLRMAA
ncbi:alpha-D-ribose 1-methylphosphonate 5-triphosphate diphosphatase, partial [Achromobacter sp. AGC25]